MSLFYTPTRIGKHGKPFKLYKFRTLVEDADKKTSFATEEVYTRYGKFLRRFKLDELPQLWNVLKGDMSFFGYRPEEAKTIMIIPEDIRKTLFTVKPGLMDLASIYFFDEERILQLSEDKHREYWEKIRPMKLVLQVFYIQNRSVLLNLALLWMVFKRLFRELKARR